MFIELENESIVAEKLKDLTELYFVVKEIIIYFEEVNPEHKTDIQPINELRNAFDHLMRCSSTWLGINKNNEGNSSSYICIHLDKSFGHVYRAGYDTVDFLALTIKGIIAKDLQKYNVDTIKTVIPEYYSTIKPDITTLNEEITQFRKNKDVANVQGEHLMRYIKKVKRIVEHHKKISKAIPELNEIQTKLSSEEKNREIYDWTKQIIIGIVIFLFGIWVGK